MSERLRIAYVRGVTPGKWARVWGERFPRAPLELAMIDPVTDASAQLAALRDGTADLAFIRLPAHADGEPEWPVPAAAAAADADAAGFHGERPDDIHFIALYQERPFVVAPKGSVLEAADEVRTAELDGEPRHPFDDDIAAAIEVIAANVGLAVVPQSIARLYARKDLISRPVADEPGWCVGLAWLRANDDARVEEFIGVVRGRSANSSRGRGRDGGDQGAAGRGDRGDRATSARRSADGARPSRPAATRSSRAGRKGRRSTR